ncbi:MAG TPA: CCA tRNA nucleotidyltransferase [Acidobacteriota bacterium]|mgnify:FL=1|nr:CCA tRNA nucleotidyltransferase [Acidobacteriota bacterium]HQM61876.1 CCA tRNA nucleotidyltransferase [Acidobacteriota bacterium]
MTPEPARPYEPSGVDPVLFGAAGRIVATLHAAGFTAYFAGGCIRDLLLGRPVQDVDIATDAVPAEIQRLFPDHRAVGAQFGVILVKLEGISFEVATFRADLAYRDGRHPEGIRFSTPAEDARRRDFTVNGLFYDPRRRVIIDYVGGEADLAARCIRTIGAPDDRFSEDHLRLMRAVRFAAGLEFTIDAATWQSLRRLAPAILRVAPERIREELLKALTRRGADTALDLLERSGLLAAVLPEASAMVGIPQPETYHPEGDVFTHVQAMFAAADYPLPDALAMGILLHDIAKPPTFRIRDRIRFHGHVELGVDLSRRIMERLRFSREETERVCALVASHLQFMHVQEMRPSRLKRFLRMDDFDLHLELHRLDCLGSHRLLDHHTFCREQLAALGTAAISPPPLLSGRDLIELGFQPGPLFKTILHEVETLQLEDRLTTREAALEHVRRRYLAAGL